MPDDGVFRTQAWTYPSEGVVVVCGYRGKDPDPHVKSSEFDAR